MTRAKRTYTVLPCVGCGKPTEGSSPAERRMCIPCRPLRAAELKAKKVARARQYYQENRARILERDRRHRERNRDMLSAAGMRKRHGPLIEDWFAETWQAQDGRCYLCADALNPRQVVVDHDHRHCPPKESCAICRRGLCCQLCNTLIGQAGDDPARLSRIASNLAAALAIVNERLTPVPGQLTLDLAGIAS